MLKDHLGSISLIADIYRMPEEQLVFDFGVALRRERVILTSYFARAPMAGGQSGRFGSTMNFKGGSMAARFLRVPLVHGK